LEPFIDFILARQAFDVANLGAWIVRLNLPIVLGNPLHFEYDTKFSHEAEYALVGLGRKPYYGVPYSK
jgi:hypothetical protein